VPYGIKSYPFEFGPVKVATSALTGLSGCPGSTGTTVTLRGDTTGAAEDLPRASLDKPTRTL
jgi:hypothetical protein